MIEVLVMVDTFEPWFLTLLRIESPPDLSLRTNMKGCLLQNQRILELEVILKVFWSGVPSWHEMGMIRPAYKVCCER